MSSTTQRSLQQSLMAVAASTLLAACTGREPVSPTADARPAFLASEPAAASGGRFPDLGGCSRLDAPEGSTMTLHVYAAGTQNYRWNGASWVFVAPDARLFVDEGGHGLVGTHFAGPTWLMRSGSQVVGAVVDRCIPDLTAIPWLKLAATASGPGVLQHTNLIQRVNTVGGLVPTTPGTVVGDEARVPYTAEYFFYHVP